MAREFSDAEVFGSHELSDEEVFGAPAKPKKTSQGLGFIEGVKTVLDKAPPSPLDFIPGLDSRPQRAKARAGTEAYIRGREQTQRPGTAGKITGQVVATLPVAAITRNPFAAGAIQGALTSEAKNPEGLAIDTLAGGALGHFGGKAVDAVADFIKPAISPAVRALNDAGVKLTPGMIKGGKAMVREDKAMSRPGIGGRIAAGREATQETFNTATVNQALTPLGVKVPPNIKAGHDAVSYAHDAVSQAYDRVVPNLAVKLDVRALAGRIQPAAATLPKPQQQQLQTILTNTIGQGNLAGRGLKQAQGELRRLASVYSRDPAAPSQELGRVLREVDDHLTSAMMAQNPKWAPELQKVNKAFRGMAIVEDAASRADGGVINTQQLKQSVRRGDFSRRKASTAQGKSFMQDFSEAARDVIPSRTPNSGTADRLNAGNLFAQARGAVDALGYEVDNIFQQGRLAPRPAAAGRVAQGVKRLKGPVTAGAVAASRQPRD
jgi:hypothetical protein